MEWEISFNEYLKAIEAKVSGTRKVELTVKMVKEILEVSGKLGVNSYLVDFTKTEGQFTVIDIHRNVNRLEEYGLSKSDKIALVARYPALENDFTETVARINGWESLKYFYNLDEACSWLKTQNSKC